MPKSSSSRKNPAANDGPRPPSWTYTNSRFWKEIEKAKKPALLTATKGLVSSAEGLATLIATELPTFTRHDRVHLDNVLYWMDVLVTEAGLKELGPVGSALCILLAYVHDLGMLPEQGWRDRLKNADGEDAKRLRWWAAEHHPDLLDIVEQCRQGSEDQILRAEWIERFIQIDYLRATHAVDGVDGRIAGHLKTLAKDNRLRSAFGFLAAEDEAIGLIASIVASHGQPVDWLARVLERKHGRCYHDGRDGRTNLVLPALLLRLADICDFDSSRTPPILFHQLGLEGVAFLGLDAIGPTTLPDEQERAAATATREWMKHLAVDRWHWEETDRLCFVASDCPHPVVERSIRHFCGEIEREVVGVRAELARAFPNKTHGWIRLPKKVEPAITPRGYHYEDLSFQLEAREVTQLLMGTALYGKPELCIRELLQNAMDAVQLRDLRLRLRDKLAAQGEHAPNWAEPVDPWNPNERQCPIRLEWGKDGDTGREWIAVHDAGTGMTLDQIRRYLCVLGRSYYKSPELSAEARLMREHGLFATPISQFGIGILSCFMVAEWLEIRTCPCRQDDDMRQAWNVKITGPGSLFHFTRERGRRPGTEVRLYLKPGFRVADIPREELLAQLRKELGYGRNDVNTIPREGTRAGISHFNPAAVAARHVVWPRYPIQARRHDEGEPVLVIDDHWHFKDLCPLAPQQLTAIAQEWNVPPSQVEGARWQTLDWVDDQWGAASTGSRIRVVFPATSFCREGILPHWSLPALVAAESDQMASRRQLVRGMQVENWDNVPDFGGPFAVHGMKVWVDLAGSASPRLTADRKEADISSRESEQWTQEVRGLFDRWIDVQANGIPAGSSARASLARGIALPSDLRMKLGSHGAGHPWRLAASWFDQHGSALQDCATLIARSLLLEGGGASLDHLRDDDLWRALDWDLSVNRRPGEQQPDDYPCARRSGHALVRDHRRTLTGERAFDFARDLALAHAYLRTQTIIQDPSARRVDHAMAWGHARTLFDALVGVQTSSSPVLGNALNSTVECHFLNEGFWPSPSDAFPLLQLPSDGGLADATHLGPAVLWWGEGPQPAQAVAKLESWAFDLVLPFSVVATPNWRRRFSAWERERHWRALLTLPFLFPSTELARKIADVLRTSPLARAQNLPESDLHVLIPRPELWDKTFDQWTKEDSECGGYSAQWDLATGEMRWAVGVVRRDDMPTLGKPWDRFLESEELSRYRERCPELFRGIEDSR